MTAHCFIPALPLSSSTALFSFLILVRHNVHKMPQVSLQSTTISNVTRSHKERHHSATWLVQKSKFEGVFFSRLSLTIGNVYFSFLRHTWVIVSCAETVTQFRMSHLYSFILCSHFGWLPYNAAPCQIACSVHLCPHICVAVHLHMLIIYTLDPCGLVLLLILIAPPYYCVFCVCGLFSFGVTLVLQVHCAFVSPGGFSTCLLCRLPSPAMLPLRVGSVLAFINVLGSK